MQGKRRFDKVHCFAYNPLFWQAEPDSDGHLEKKFHTNLSNSKDNKYVCMQCN